MKHRNAGLGPSLAIGALLVSGCSSTPLSAGHENYYGPTAEAFSAVRTAQAQADQGLFTGVDEAEERIAQKFAKADCFRIVSSTTQWGLLEPEAVFEGESARKPGERAFIFVPPVLSGLATYPTPKEKFHVSVYRVDAEAPMSAKIIQQLELATGRRDLCIRFARVSDRGLADADFTVTAAQVQSAE